MLLAVALGEGHGRCINSGRSPCVVVNPTLFQIPTLIPEELGDTEQFISPFTGSVLATAKMKKKKEKEKPKKTNKKTYPKDLYED